jgi:hypothetical protein
MRLYKPNRSLVVGVFTGVALLGIASMTDMRGIVVAMEYPEFAQYWDEFGLRYAIKVPNSYDDTYSFYRSKI